MNDQNRWKVCNYDDDGVGFPRDCGPKDLAGGQWSSGWKHRGRAAQFYVKKLTNDKEFGANHLHLKYSCLKYQRYVLVSFCICLLVFLLHFLLLSCSCVLFWSLWETDGSHVSRFLVHHSSSFPSFFFVCVCLFVCSLPPHTLCNV